MTARTTPAAPAERGYQPLYHPEGANHCPGCGRSHWYVGRLTAECAFCCTAIPLFSPAVASPLNPACSAVSSRL